MAGTQVVIDFANSPSFEEGRLLKMKRAALSGKESWAAFERRPPRDVPRGLRNAQNRT